ncbi:MAG: hypothetical protein PHW24_02530 [Candidatus Moranbacteria bacterium]|nr:hypothetical protein [Candidatus Moranbacteria bacterium]
MANIRVLFGPDKFAGKVLPIPDEVRKIGSTFTEMVVKRCFWVIDMSGLDENQSYEVKVMDFSARCVRSICMGIPVFIDGQKVVATTISKKSIDAVLHKVINLLAVSNGNMIFAEDSNKELRIEIIPNAGSDDFEDMIFANT